MNLLNEISSTHKKHQTGNTMVPDTDGQPIASWQRGWRRGIAPQLSTNGLVALQHALETDDQRLIQGATTKPPPLQSVQDWPCEAACAVSYAGVVEHGGFYGAADNGLSAATVGQAEEYFARVCYEADLALQEPAGCRYFLNWFDDTPREQMRPLLLSEVKRELARREQGK